MKHRNIFFSILCLFLYINTIQTEGFCTGTLVKTASGYSDIQSLKSQDEVTSSGLFHNFSSNAPIITKTHNYKSDFYVKIIIGNSILCCAPNQKLYSYNQQKWIRADTLAPTDLLINDGNEPITIDEIQIIQEPCTLHALSLTADHTYCVSPHNIVVHNTGPVIVVYLPAIVSTITPIVETCLATAATFFGIQFFAKKIKQKQSPSNYNYSSLNNSDSYYPDPNDPHDDKNKRDDKEHPHGIYKDADYHHRNSSGPKSPSPDNGQRCLDYSIRVGEQRVTIEGNHFVVLRLTRPGEWHGFKVSWNQLNDKLQAVLIKYRFVKKTGKIIRQITEKFPS